MKSKARIRIQRKYSFIHDLLTVCLNYIIHPFKQWRCIMNGFTFKKVAMILILIATNSFAVTAESTDAHKTQKVYGKAGCMMCHQGEATQSEDEPRNETNKSTAKQ